jgi:hypothetical protein
MSDDFVREKIIQKRMMKIPSTAVGDEIRDAAWVESENLGEDLLMADAAAIDIELRPYVNRNMKAKRIAEEMLEQLVSGPEREDVVRIIAALNGETDV